MKGLSCTASIAPASSSYRAYQLHPGCRNRWVIAPGSIYTDALFTYCVEAIEAGGETTSNPDITELLLVVKGEGYAQSAHQTMELQAGDSVLTSSTETYSIRNVGLGRLYILRLMPHEALLQQLRQAIPVEVDAEDLAILHQSSLAVSHHFPFLSPFSR